MIKSLLKNLKTWWNARELDKAMGDVIQEFSSIPPAQLVEELHDSYKLGPATVYLMKPGLEGKEELKQRMMGLSAENALKRLELEEKSVDLFMSKLVFAPKRKRAVRRRMKRDPKQRGLNS